MKFLSSVLFCLLTLAIFAQPKQNSPYSRYGLGDPYPQYFAQQGAMGGLTTANHDPFHLNLANPASFAHLRATAFETGLYAKNSSFKTSTSTLNAWSGNLTHFALGFTLKSPINEALDRKQSPWKYGMGLGFTPVNLVGYNIETSEFAPDLGNITNAFEGKGGLYQLAWGASAKYKRTSFGAKLGWVFGKSAYENTTTFRDTITALIGSHFQNNFREELLINGLTWKIGAMHDFVLKNDVNNKDIPSEWLTAGLTFNSNHNLNGTGNTLKIRSLGRLSNGTYSNPDTLVYLPDQKAEIKLPAAVSFGLTYVKANKLKLGIQYDFAAWSNYENNVRPYKMRNTSSISAGLEFIPNHISYNKFLDRIRYRLGAYFRQDRTVGGKNVDDLGLSFGFGMPVILPRQGTSFVNSSFEFGKIGGGTSIAETYFRINLGFTLNDNSWFYKRRFE